MKNVSYGYNYDKTNKTWELFLQQAGKPSLKFAWLLDKLKVERDRNHSIDSKTRRVETSVYNMVVIDCPGHRNYVHNMITGISQVLAPSIQ